MSNLQWTNVNRLMYKFWLGYSIGTVQSFNLPISSCPHWFPIAVLPVPDKLGQVQVRVVLVSALSETDDRTVGSFNGLSRKKFTLLFFFLILHTSAHMAMGYVMKRCHQSQIISNFLVELWWYSFMEIMKTIMNFFNENEIWIFSSHSKHYKLE